MKAACEWSANFRVIEMQPDAALAFPADSVEARWKPHHWPCSVGPIGKRFRADVGNSGNPPQDCA